MKIMDGKKFPQLPDEIPNELLSEEWANKIHGQTLHRLNERGGMSIIELLMNIKKLSMDDMYRVYGYNFIPTEQEASELAALLNLNP